MIWCSMRGSSGGSRRRCVWTSRLPARKPRPTRWTSAACRIINIKPGRMGGFGPSLAVHDLARRRGIPVWHGGMLESGIGRAHNLHLSTLPGFTLPGDVAASRRYFVPDLIDPPIEVARGRDDRRAGGRRESASTRCRIGSAPRPSSEKGLSREVRTMATTRAADGGRGVVDPAARPDAGPTPIAAAVVAPGAAAATRHPARYEGRLDLPARAAACPARRAPGRSAAGAARSRHGVDGRAAARAGLGAEPPRARRRSQSGGAPSCGARGGTRRHARGRRDARRARCATSRPTSARPPRLRWV